MLPPLDALLDGAVAYAVPLSVPFRGTAVREGLLLRGPLGWAEFAPFPEYGPPLTARWLAAAVEAGWEGWPEPVRDEVPVNAIVPAVDPDTAAALVRASGCAAAKVKVAERGRSLLDDVARVAAVRDELGDGAIRVDANGAWSFDEAVEALSVLGAFGLEYVEQPCASLADCARVRLATGLPVAVDEGVRLAADPEHVAGLREAADVLVLKVPPLGGVRAGLRVAQTYGLPCVVSSAVDTSVGLAAGVALAAALPELRYACGLGTGRLLARDVAVPALLPVAGRLRVGRAQVDDVAVSAVAADPTRLAAWRSRLVAGYEVLSGGGA